MANVTCNILVGQARKNLKTAYGTSLSNGALSALLTPCAVKERITNESRLEKGKRIDTTVEKQYQPRDLTLEMHIIASNLTTLQQYKTNLINDLSNKEGVRFIVNAYGKTFYYTLFYVSCTQFAQYGGTLAKLAIRFTEPQPNDGAAS